ncbi:PREDICTED: uncharacterized protein LOC106923621 isoform X4 [Poecilia mexicana]|uniref:uncharacterized protein LOC106923621 isoform X4 n=1 Tax=Poecilia mexicana TaxID=48701 RepID=UPI00072E4F7B|nr:PREDICTED: uncharacterized protein LOC106923621 isoform X4 [Poecilia mexicana]
MKERRDGSAVPEFDIGRKPEATGDQNLQPDSGSAQKILESGESVDQRTDASDLQSSVMSPGRVFPLDELPASQGATGHTSCPETPNSTHGDPVFLDHPGGKAPPCEPETDSQLPDPKSQQENIYGSVLHQMLQQQKHKHGRRYKKKTLMKMARLLVIAKGWDHRENQSLSLQEEMDLKEEISVSIQGKKVPGNPDTSRNLSGEIRSESNSEETKIPPERRRKTATEAPKAAGEKTDETPGGSGSDFTLKNKEEKPKTEKDPELKLRKKAGRKRIGEPESLSVSPGGKQRRKRAPVAQIQITPTASEANEGLSGFAGNTAAQETEPQESKRKPRKSRNPSAERLPTGGGPLPEENRTKPEEEASSLDVFPKLQLEKRGAKTNKMSIWDQLPSAEMSNIQNETGKNRTKTVPAEEETMHWDERRGTFSQKLDEDPIRSWKKPKGQGRKKKIRQQTLNFQSKTQPVWEAPTSRLDFSPTNTMPANPSTENQEFTNWDESYEAWKFGKIRRSCTLGTKTSSAADEWLSQYLKGSQRKASCKASNIPELMGKDELENGTKFKQTKRGQKKSTGPSANGETAPGNVKRKGKKAKQESAVELNKDRLGFPTLPASNSVSNRQEEERMRRKRTVRRKTGPKRRQALNIKTGTKILESEVKHPNEGDPGSPEDGKPSSVRRGRQKNVFTTKKEDHETEKSQLMSSFQDKSNTTENGVTPETKGKKNLLQIEGTSLKDGSLEVKSKTAPRKMKKSPKKRRILKKHSIIEPKILESDEKHPDEGDPGSPEDGKPSSGVRRGRTKNVLPIRIEDEISNIIDILEADKETEKEKSQLMTSELTEPNQISLLRIEGISDPKDDFPETKSKMAPRKMKRGRKKRRMLRKRSATGPKVLESDGKHPETGTPEDGKPSNQDRNSSMGSGGQTRATPKPDRIILLQIEGTSGLKDDSLNIKSKMAPRKMKKGRKKRQILRKRSTTRAKILDSDEKPEEDDPGASEDGKPSIHDENSPEDSGGHTGATPEPDRIEGTSARKEDFLGVKTVRRKSGPKRKRVLKKNLKAELKILESEERHPDPGSPEDGKPSSVRSRRKTNDFTIKMEEEPIFIEMGANKESKMEKSQLMFSFQDKSNTTESGSKTRATPEVQGKMNLLQTEGVPTDPKDDSGKVFSMVQGQIQSFQKDSARPKIQESGDHPYERDAGASEDGRMSKTSNTGHGRKTNVFTIKLENGASNKEPEAEKPFQESASSTAPGKTRQKRRRRSRTHWSGHRKAKKPRVCSFWDVPAVSSSCDQTFNIQQENQENQMTTNAPSGSEISHHLQKKNKNLQCSFCLRSFRHISALTLHKRLHTARKPYGCSVCAKSFSTLPELKLHSKLHRGPPATHCPICEETFRDKTKLIRHLKVHLAEVEGLQTEPGRSRRSRSASSQEETFRCPVCSREFTKKSAFENHRRIHDRKAFRNPRRIHGFHVSGAGDTTVVTPVFFKCPICRQIHRRWCHYVLHLHSHMMGKPHHCYVCRQEYSRAAGSRRHCSVCCRASGEEAACRGSLEDIWKETGDSVSPRKISAIPEEEGNGKAFIPPPSSGGSSPSVIEDFDVDVSSLNFGFSNPTFSPEPPRLSLQSWCGRFGNKRRPHRRAFRCSRCELEFHFLGSYMDHLQEHAPKTPNACLSCNKPWLEPRFRQLDGLKCSTCGKLFSTSRNLRKHKLLHKAAHSHICLPCGRSFPGHSALEAHLEAHRRRLSVPRPARVEEPFLFPYPCRKCSARFSSTDLLEAHQVCHSFAGRKPESPPESILSFIPNPQTVAVSSPGPKRWLLVSNRKDLFRYPHPDHLYVVPAASSETLAVVSETPDIGLDLESGANPTSAELQLQLLVKSLIPEKRLTTSDSSDSEDEPTVLRQNCAICMQTFTDVATLHEHYRNHARGM